MAGLALRIWTAQATVLDGAIRSDGLDYVSCVANLQVHGVYASDHGVLRNADAPAPAPDARRPPGYPLFLAPMFARQDLAGFVHRVAVAQALLGALVVWLAGLLARRALGDGAGLLVAALVALSPHLAVYTPYLLTETLYSLAVVGLAWAGAASLLARSQASGWLLAGLSGALLGLACLVRPTLDQMAWALVIIVLVVPACRRHAARLALFVLAFALVMAPWWIRNLEVGVTGASGAMAITIQQGSYPDMMRNGDPATLGYPYRGDPAAPAAEASVRAALAYVVHRFEAEPLRMIRWFLVGKPLALFAWDEQSGWHGMFEYPVLASPWLQAPTLIALTSLMKTLHWPLVLLALGGTLLGLTPWVRRVVAPGAVPAVRVVALVHAYFIVVHLAALPLSRYGVPFRPITYLLAVLALVAIGQWLQRVLRVAGAGETPAGVA